MNKDLKAKWLTALRSGEYKQGRGALHGDDDRYCCLGVLCAVAGRLTGYHGTLYGAGAIDLINGNDAVHNTLVPMNDGSKDVRQHSFPEIADWIEANISTEAA